MTKHYRVDLSQTVYESCTVYVEAENEEAAEALALARSSEVEWRFDEVHDRDVLAVVEEAGTPDFDPNAPSPDLQAVLDWENEP